MDLGNDEAFRSSISQPRQFLLIKRHEDALLYLTALHQRITFWVRLEPFKPPSDGHDFVQFRFDLSFFVHTRFRLSLIARLVNGQMLYSWVVVQPCAARALNTFRRSAASVPDRYRCGARTSSWFTFTLKQTARNCAVSASVIAAFWIAARLLNPSQTHVMLHINEMTGVMQRIPHYQSTHGFTQRVSNGP